MTIQEYVQYGTMIVGFATMAGIAFVHFRRSGRGESGEIIKFYKEEAASYKDMMVKKDESHANKIKELHVEFNDKFNTLTKDFGILQGQYTAEKAAREQYEAIVKDKNPETKAFMEFVVNAVSEQGKVNKEVVEILREIHQMQKEEHAQDLKVLTTSTITKQ